MAIINCPECGGSISDTVRQCVHCGSSITVCRECNKIYTDNPVCCPSCGYEFVSVGGDNDEEEKECKTAASLHKKWKEGLQLTSVVLHPALAWIFIGLAGLFAIIAWFKLKSWNDFTTYSSTLSMVNNLILVAVLFFIFGSLMSSLGEFFRTTLFMQWCAKKGIDYEKVVGNSLRLDYHSLSIEKACEEIDATKACCRAASYNANYIHRNLIRNCQIACAVIETVALVFAYLYFTGLVEVFMSAELMESESLGISGFTADKVENQWMILVAFGLYFVSILVSTYIGKRNESECKLWVKRNLPTLLPIYNKFVADDQKKQYMKSRMG